MIVVNFLCISCREGLLTSSVFCDISVRSFFKALHSSALKKDRTLIKKLVNAMPDCVEAVIKAKGGVAKY